MRCIYWKFNWGYRHPTAWYGRCIGLPILSYVHGICLEEITPA